MPDHATNTDPTDVGGDALVGGFLLVIGVLYARNPAGAVDAATAGLGAAVYFVVLPALGVATGAAEQCRFAAAGRTRTRCPCRGGRCWQPLGRRR